MKLNIKTPGQPESKVSVAYVKKLLNQFSKDHSTVSEADVRLTFGSEHGNDRLCGIYLKIGEKNIFTIQKSSSFEQSARKAVAKLQTQINNINQII
jgi:ribosome-associated translation inhibitor RaiA